MSLIKRIGLVAAITLACMPAASQARPLHDYVPPADTYQDLRGGDAKGEPAGAGEFPPPAPRVRIVEVPSPGIDWGDATIGATGALVGLLLATAAGMAVVRRRAGM
jgi:hypothetical protein